MLGFAIGDGDMVTGFRLVGLDGVEVNSIEQAKFAFNEALGQNDLAIILISEEFSAQMRSDIDKIRSERIAPIIIEVPGRRGPLGEMKMSELVSRTLGVKI